MQTSYCLNPKCPQPRNTQDASNCQTCGHKLLLRGRYRAFKKLGQGGFGTTFLCKDLDMPSQPWRVIKQLRLNEASPQIAELSKELFMREAQVLERLGTHSQIPTLYAYFEEGNHFYLVQEFVLGNSLSGEIQKLGAMSVENVRNVLQEVLLILSFVHDRQTIHRDIKPANLMRRKEDGRLVLIDFGAVREVGKNENRSSVTAIRSLGFSPPEQVAGQQVFPASDIYALGATCINLLTKESPAKFFDYQRGVWNWRPFVPNIDEGFAQIIDTMVQPRLGERYATATDVLRALQQWKQGNLAAPNTAPTMPSPLQTPTQPPAARGWGSNPATSPPNRVPTSTNTEPPTRPVITGKKRVPPPPRPLAASRTPAAAPSMIGADFRDRELAQENFSGRDLRRADLRGTNLRGANLRGADLRGVQFTSPPPRWQHLLGRFFWGAKTLGSVIGGGSALLLTTGGVGWGVYRLTGQTLWAVLAGLGAALIAGGIAWKMTGQLMTIGNGRRGTPQRYTNLREADLRGAQLDAPLLKLARAQGARLQ